MALLLGAVVTSWFVGALRSHLNIPPSAGRAMPGWLMGLSERLFFTLIIAFDVSGAAIAMIGKSPCRPTVWPTCSRWPTRLD